jgi:hypothetical protein
VLVVAEHRRQRALRTLGDADVRADALGLGNRVADLLANVAGTVHPLEVFDLQLDTLGPGTKECAERYVDRFRELGRFAFGHGEDGATAR